MDSQSSGTDDVDGLLTELLDSFSMPTGEEEESNPSSSTNGVDEVLQEIVAGASDGSISEHGDYGAGGEDRQSLPVAEGGVLGDHHDERFLAHYESEKAEENLQERDKEPGVDSGQELTWEELFASSEEENHAEMNRDDGAMEQTRKQQGNLTPTPTSSPLKDEGKNEGTRQEAGVRVAIEVSEVNETEGGVRSATSPAPTEEKGIQSPGPQEWEKEEVDDLTWLDKYDHAAAKALAEKLDLRLEEVVGIMGKGQEVLQALRACERQGVGAGTRNRLELDHGSALEASILADLADYPRGALRKSTMRGVELLNHLRRLTGKEPRRSPAQRGQRAPRSAPARTTAGATVTKKEREQQKQAPRRQQSAKAKAEADASTAAYALVVKEFDPSQKQHRDFAHLYFQWRKESKRDKSAARQAYAILERKNIFSKQLDEILRGIAMASPAWPSLVRTAIRKEEEERVERERLEAENMARQRAQSTKESFQEFLRRYEEDLKKREEAKKRFHEAIEEQERMQSRSKSPASMRPPKVAFRSTSNRRKALGEEDQRESEQGTKKRLTPRQFNEFVHRQQSFVQERNRKLASLREEKMEHEKREAAIFAAQGLPYPPGFEAPPPF